MPNYTPIDLKKLSTDILNTTYSPRELADHRMKLHAELAYLGEELSEVIIRKANVMQELRDRSDSEKQCERLWDQTEDGKKEAWLRLRLKNIERLSSGIKTKLDVMEKEARNYY